MSPPRSLPTVWPPPAAPIRAPHLQPIAKPARENPFAIGFTKSNELFVGRVAMIGFASSLIGG